MVITCEGFFMKKRVILNGAFVVIKADPASDMLNLFGTDEQGSDLVFTHTSEEEEY